MAHRLQIVMPAAIGLAVAMLFPHLASFVAVVLAAAYTLAAGVSLGSLIGRWLSDRIENETIGQFIEETFRFYGFLSFAVLLHMVKTTALVREWLPDNYTLSPFDYRIALWVAGGFTVSTAVGMAMRQQAR